jgi:hypothetical protein
MRYPQKHMSRKYIVVAVLLLGVGTLAAAAATHVRMSSQQRADIELLTPAPEKSASARPAAGQSAAPLFAVSSVSRTRPVSEIMAMSGLAGAVPTAQTFQQQLQARRYSSGRYQDYAGERTRRRGNASVGSGGAFSGGGGGFSGGGGGVSGTAPARTRGAASTTPAPRPAAAARASNNNNRNGGSGGSGGSGASGSSTAVPAAVVAAAVPVTGATPVPGSGPSPAGAPEPLTLLLVGTGLAGLYGARKHIA